MPSANLPLDFSAILDDRTLLSVTGPDAAPFLQNIMTNDIRKAEGGQLVYSCLLTPQGQFLHDFFVAPVDGGFLIDISKARAGDFISRIGIFKLRAKVDVAETQDITVLAGREGFTDPRHPALPARRYTGGSGAGDKAAYHDYCISLGIPDTSAMMPQVDILADINLDLLNAVAWDKGCFIGQEVTARVRYKALAKKRLLIASGEPLALPPEIGEIRQISSDEKQALAVIRLAKMDHCPITLARPDYLPL